MSLAPGKPRFRYRPAIVPVAAKGRNMSTSAHLHPLRPLAMFVIGALFSGFVHGVEPSGIDPSNMTATQIRAAKLLPQLEQLRVDRAGVPQHLSARLGFLPLQDKALKRALPEFLEQLRPLLRHAGQLHLQKVTSEPDGLRHVLLEQRIDGHDVRNAGMTLHVRSSDGAVVALDANLIASDAAPRMAKRSAEHVFRALPRDESLPADARLSGTPKLVYWRGSDADAFLAWELNATAAVGDEVEEYELIVDSDSGQLLANSALGPLLRNREVWRENSEAEEEATGDWETLMRDETTVYPGGDAEEYSTAFEHAGSTYTYFLHSFGRDSWDGLGSKMSVEIKEGRGFNAGWDRIRKRAWFYRAGPTPSIYDATYKSLDAVAHEFGHGVTRSTINLQTTGLPGALDETLSDVHGAMTEASTLGGVSAETWRMYNESYRPGSSALAYRYMNDPALDSEVNSSMFSRDHWNDRYLGTDHRGGAHYNSGIGNLAYYLLAMGGRHPRGKTSNWVTAIGTKRAQEIYYWAVHGGYLAGNTQSTFVEFRTATTEVAAARYGGVDLLSVCGAWDAVGVFNGTANRRCPTSGGLLAPPTSVTAVRTCNPVTVRWTAAPASTGQAVTYEVFRSNNREDFSGSTRVYAGTALRFSSTLPSSDGTGNTLRHFRVRACNSKGCGPLSQVVASVDALPTYMCTLQ
jgi:Zn-dependent metalloprotease